MAIFKFIGSSSEDIATKRGDVLPGIRLFYITALKNGKGCYGASKLVPLNRVGDIGGLPVLGSCYDVSFNQWGNIDGMTPLSGDPIQDVMTGDI